MLQVPATKRSAKRRIPVGVWCLILILLIGGAVVAGWAVWPTIVPPSGLVKETTLLDHPPSDCHKQSQKYLGSGPDGPPTMQIKYSCNGDYNTVDTALSSMLNAQGCKASTEESTTDNPDASSLRETYSYSIGCNSARSLIKGGYGVEINQQVKGELSAADSDADTPVGDDPPISGYTLLILAYGGK